MYMLYTKKGNIIFIQICFNFIKSLSRNFFPKNKKRKMKNIQDENGECI